MCRAVWEEHSKKPFGRRKLFAAKNPRRQTCHFAPKLLLTMALKLTLSRKMQKRVEGTGRQMQRSDGGALCKTFQGRKGPALEDQRDHETCAAFVNLWWNLRGTFHKPFGSLRRIRPREPETLTKLGEPWWNVPRNLLAAQDGSAPENQRHRDREVWWSLGENLVETWWKLGRTLVERSAEP